MKLKLYSNFPGFLFFIFAGPEVSDVFDLGEKQGFVSLTKPLFRACSAA